MAEVIIPSSATDGRIGYNVVGSYPQSRTGLTGNSIDTAADLACLNTLITTTYYAFRSFLYFDTSTIPTDAEIISAVVSIYSIGTQHEADAGHSDIQLFRGSQAASLSVADYASVIGLPALVGTSTDN